MPAILAFFQSLPLLLGLAQQLWTFVVKISDGDPLQLLKDIHAIMVKVNESKTFDDRDAAAQKVASVWADTFKPGS